MRYAALILLAGCVQSSGMGAPKEGGSDVDTVELEGSSVTTIAPVGAMGGMAGMDSGGAGAQDDGGGGTGGGAGGTESLRPEGPDSGAGGATGSGGSEAPIEPAETPVEPQWAGCLDGFECTLQGIGNMQTLHTCLPSEFGSLVCGPSTHVCFPCGDECTVAGGTCRPVGFSVSEGYPEFCYIPCAL